MKKVLRKCTVCKLKKPCTLENFELQWKAWSVRNYLKHQCRTCRNSYYLKLYYNDYERKKAVKRAYYHRVVKPKRHVGC